MGNFEKETMEIINAISEYIYLYGDKKTIEIYYQEHGTYNGIVEYLSNIITSKKSESNGQTQDNK